MAPIESPGYAFLIHLPPTNTHRRAAARSNFLKGYRPPNLFFRDIFSSDGIAEIDSEIDLSLFESEGGKLLVLS